MGDAPALAYACKNIVQFVEPFGGDDQIDMAADRFSGGISEQVLGGRIPGGDGTVEFIGDDGVV